MMGKYILGDGERTISMDMGHTTGLLEMSILGSTRMAKGMGRVHSLMLTEQCTPVSGGMTLNTTAVFPMAIQQH